MGNLYTLWTLVASVSVRCGQRRLSVQVIEYRPSMVRELEICRRGTMALSNGCWYPAIAEQVQKVVGVPGSRGGCQEGRQIDSTAALSLLPATLVWRLARK